MTSKKETYTICEKGQSGTVTYNVGPRGVVSGLTMSANTKPHAIAEHLVAQGVFGVTNKKQLYRVPTQNSGSQPTMRR